ncbi:MAG: ABC transporter permease, partial [Calditrichia bacterium]
MKKTIKIIKREFLTKVSSKGFLIGTVLGPILMIGLLLGPAYFMNMSQDNAMTIQLVDYSRNLAENVRETFSDTLTNGQPRFVFSQIQPETYERDRDLYRGDIEKGGVDAILVIPEDILQNGSVSYLSKSVSDIDLIQRLQNGLSEIINARRLQNAGYDPSLIKELTQKVDFRTIKVVKGEEKARGFDQEFLSSMIFLFILYMTIIVYGSSIMRGVIEEKSSRIVEVLLSSTNSFELMMGKLLGVGSVGLVQYIIWAGMGMAAVFMATNSMPGIAQYINVSPAVLFYFVLFFVVGFFTFSTLYAAVGAMCSDMQDAQSFSTPVTLLIVIPFFISFAVIKDPTTTL